MLDMSHYKSNPQPLNESAVDASRQEKVLLESTNYCLMVYVDEH